MSRRTDIVVTTIFEPTWLDGYLSNLRTYGRERETTLRIACDRKTPASVYTAAAAALRQGFLVDCPTLEEQGAYLRRVGLPEDFVPWDSDNRRNIGFLRAWESGADVLISIDDDNYCPAGEDFVGAHAIVGTCPTALRTTNGAPWFNHCELLETNVRAPVFPRGFPYAARTPGAAEFSEGNSRTIALNAGLSIGDPDVDATTRLTLAPKAKNVNGAAVALAPDTWSPVNTQNTGVMRAALPAYYYVRMGFPLQGLHIDRFGDILSGYFAQKCAKHLDHAVRLGTPITDHRRTTHNLFKDQYHELAGIVLVEDLLPWLRETKLQGTSYRETYRALADALEAQASSYRGFIWDQGGREFLVETAKAMRTWLTAIASLE